MLKRKIGRVIGAKIDKLESKSTHQCIVQNRQHAPLGIHYTVGRRCLANKRTAQSSYCSVDGGIPPDHRRTVYTGSSLMGHHSNRYHNGHNVDQRIQVDTRKCIDHKVHLYDRSLHS